ncbi:type VI secretion system protein ImpG [Marivita lacus]|uniref:Type VI secretion system protein ImpG n=1 Tax=Marivita lacus TaxID=1323742 RepID=A0ABQ1L799_9RHOB|nr:type VI secretion system baseplate subunit TssF [Marivita lacus]GGC18998.1 type VI secretion system protein ImpG [Marivita lacus]
MDQILQYYETELDYMRRAFDAFAATHPQKAKALGISAGRSSDPDVQRLADSVALHAARLSKRLDDTLPETALDLIRMLAPTFLLGAPSYGAVKLDAQADELSDPVTLRAGTRMPVTLTADSTDCLFTVARDVGLKPCEIRAVTLERAPLRFDVPEDLRGCEAAICITLAPFDASQGLRDVGLDRLELYVSASGGRKHRLIDVLSGDVLGVGYAAARTDLQRARQSHMVPLDGFGLTMGWDNSTFLPREASQPPALSRLRDFLAYPDKASFFTLSQTDGGFQACPTGPVELRFFLSSEGAQKLSSVELGDLATNVVPVVNLYLDQSLPVRYDYARTQVPVKPSSASDMNVACLQIRDIRKLTSEGEALLPRITSPRRRDTRTLPVWQERFVVGEFDLARREVSFSVEAGLGPDPEPLDFVADLYCSNGKAAFALRPGTRVFFSDDRLAETPFRLLDEPSVPILPDMRAERLWDVLSLINGNFTTVFDAQSPVEALKEALHLCAPSGYADVANAIWDVTVTQSIAPVQIGRKVLLSSGSQIEVVLDIEALPFARHVFATALHLYFASLISYDRFFKLSLRERGRNQPFKVFKRQHGGQVCG